MTPPNRLARQIQFIVEIDKLKQIVRQSYLTDASRLENSVEHSWHLAMMAWCWRNTPMNRILMRAGSSKWC
ncbi:MAG: HD domain-containing protein [Desulfobacterales bacterium]